MSTPNPQPLSREERINRLPVRELASVVCDEHLEDLEFEDCVVCTRDECKQLRATCVALEQERDRANHQSDLLEEANRKVGRQLLEFGDEINRRGEQIEEFRATLAQYEAELRKCSAALRQMLDSAHPHPTEHPTMTAAWPIGRAALAAANALLEPKA